MGLLTDILKEIPQAAVLKEKIAAIEAKYAATETENAILKDDLHQAKVEIAQLKKQVEELSHNDLDENDALILQSIATANESPWPSALAAVTGLHIVVVQFHLHRLLVADYVHRNSENCYSLKQKGRAYLIQNKLI